MGAGVCLEQCLSQIAGTKGICDSDLMFHGGTAGIRRLCPHSITELDLCYFPGLRGEMASQCVLICIYLAAGKAERLSTCPGDIWILFSMSHFPFAHFFYWIVGFLFSSIPMNLYNIEFIIVWVMSCRYFFPDLSL